MDDDLEKLLEEAREGTVVPFPGNPSPPERRPSIAKVSYTHDAMIDLILANPAISQNQLALHFGYTPSWISTILASDAFQARMAERSKEMVDPILKMTIEENFKGLVYRSLEVLREKLDRPAASIPDNLALRTLEVSSRALGYGAKDNSPPVPHTEMHVHLNVLGERLTHLLKQKKAEAADPPPLEGDFTNVQTQGT